MSNDSSGRPHYVASAVPTDHHPAQAKLHKTVGRSSGARSFALLLLLGTLLGMAPGLASASHEAIGPPVFTPLGLPVNDLEFDRHSGKIYASVPSRAGALGNRIVQIDPKTGALGPSVFVGSEPSYLAVSDDGQYLYVGLQGAAAVRRVHLPSFTAGLQFALGSDPNFGPFFVDDIEVVPWDAETVAVSRMKVGFSPRHEGVAIYENGVKRTDETPDSSGSNRIEFGSSRKALVQPDTRLYGYNHESTEFGFRRMAVGLSGVSTLDVTSNLISDFSVDIAFEDGEVYATSGRVIDPEALTLVGTYPVGSGGPVLPDSDHDRVSFIAASELKMFDLETFVPLPSYPIPGISGTPDSLIEIGDGNLAFRTTADQVFLVRFPTGAISSPPGLPGPTEAAQAQIEHLRLEVKTVANRKLGEHLDSKLRDALAALASDRDRACSELAEFNNVVRAQRGRRIPAAAATTWIADVSRIQAVLGC